jgi:uncharacterized protein YqgC (DUF456 family)
MFSYEGMSPVVLWVLAIALMLAGIVGLILPALPGVPLMFAGMVVAAAIDDFQRIGWITLTVLGVLTLIAVVVDFLASVWGVKYAGASKRAIWGALIGTAVGLFFGLPGLIFGPFFGALVGELTVHGRLNQAGRAGIATWLGLIFGTLAKVAIAFAMLGVFVLAYFL